MDEKLEINCAAVGARLYFDEAAEWEAAKEAATAAGNMERAHVCATNAEANRVAGRNALLQAGLPADQAATIEPVRLVKLTAEDVALAVTDAAAGVVSAMAAVRSHRDALLGLCDWVELPTNKDRLTAAGTMDAWLTYRQALRDFPGTVGDPLNPPVWPVAP